MKAARYYAAKDIRVEDVPDPGAPGAGEVLIEPAWCGICGTDLHEYTAGPIVTPAQEHALTGATLPQILGHEYSGTVLDVGEGVSHVRPGDRIAGMPLISCGQCFHCLRGDRHMCVVMGCTGLSYQWGAIAERAIVPSYQLTRLPDALTLEQGALLEPAAVAVYAIERAHLLSGDIVLVAGLGPIGALVAMAATATGAGLVLAAEPNPNRAGRAPDFGVDEVIPVGEGFAERVAEITDDIGVDAAIECSGTQGGLSGCLEAVRGKGTVVQAGLHTQPATVDVMAHLSLKDIQLEATWCYPVQAWPRVARLTATGRFPIEKVISKRTSIDRVVADGFDPLIDPAGNELKVLVSANLQ